MKPALSRIAIVLLFAFLISCGGEKMIRITVTNPGKTERNNQPVVLQKIQLQATYPDIKLEMLQAVGEDGQPVLTQADDLDGDGEADELVLLADFQAGETRIFMLNSVTEKPAIGTAHTYAANWKRIPGSDSFESVDDDAISPAHKRSDYRYDGVGWESNVIGYRLYLDERNATDVFGKHHPGLVLEQLGTNTEDYQQDLSWGTDVLHVGTARGIGGFGIWQDGKIVLPDSMTEHRCRIISRGPVRAVVRVDFNGWQTEGQTVDLSWLLMIYDGGRATENHVLLHSGADQLILASGIVKHEPAPPVWDPQQGWLYTLGAQSRTPDSLMLALVVPPGAVLQQFEAKDDHLLLLKLQREKPLMYFFSAKWQGEDGHMWGRKDIEAHLHELHQQLAAPLVVSYR